MHPSVAIASVWWLTMFWAPVYVAPYVALEMMRLSVKEETKND